MAKYKKRSDGRYQSNICIDIDKETGKRLFKTIYARTIQDLENEKSDIKEKLNKGIYADDKGLTVGEWAIKWFETDKSTCGIRTKEMYERLVKGHIVPGIGSIRLRDLKKSDIQLLINRNSEHFRTCEQIRMAVRQMLDSAIEDGLIYKNVGLKIILPPKYKEEKRALKEIEKVAISKVDFTDYEKAFVYILLYCGIRRGEILALSRNDIDLKSREIKIRNAITFDGNNPVLKNIPKTINGIRNIPIPDALYSILKTYVSNLNSLYLFEMRKRGGLMTKTSYNKLWSSIIDKINIAAGGRRSEKATKDKEAVNEILVIHGLTAHVFRHNYATMLYYSGIDVKDAQRLLGHSNIKITLDLYTHLDQSKSNAKDKLSALCAL
jgi:integrase